VAPASAAQLIMVEEEGCEWCEVWDEEVGSIYKLTAEGKKLPLIRKDIDQISESGYNLKSSVHYTPTFIIVEDNTEVGRISGYPGESFFWEMLGQIIKEVDAQ
jgi:thioredoxin-related protein